ncbi:glycoside hydrolase family 3 protein [Lentzea tibetensis]|uniref:beta-N-acetylhexosaminidase n=1 Tax=Lentzea tibetensis TaxID=2591470 RepID=A0A563EKJ9_9PSEU|nr:glycoside hydrolase family 3 N-terminal domain-containing protein [Lentzea tibetensis]TWP47493.1 glycoside hydrolase family 3 protein [Lentzea tibetensis]
MNARRLSTPALLVVLATGALVAALLYTPTVVSGRGGAAPGVSLPTSSSSSPSATAAAPPVDKCAAPIAALTPRARLAQLVMVGVNPTGPADSLALVTGEQIGGIFIGGDDPGLLSNGALQAVHAAAKVPLTVAVDDEGGRVQRIEMLDGQIPSARRMTATMAPPAVQELARKRGEALKARGVTMDLAPVLDTSPQPDNTVIGDRSFSADPAVVRTYASAFAAGLRASGVAPVLKHFPGHGNASGDSHQGTVTTPPLEQLRGNDLVPYRDIAAYGPAAVMVGHLVVPGLTGDLPATLSQSTYELLRKEFAFSGLVMTDDLGAMKAVSARFPLPEAVLRALTSGADIALWSSGGHVTEVLTRLEQALASGELPAARMDQALRHVLTSKGVC